MNDTCEQKSSPIFPENYLGDTPYGIPFLRFQTGERRIMTKLNPGSIPTLETRAESYGLVPKEVRYKQILEVMSDFNRPMTAKEIAHNMNMRGYIPTSERNFTAPRLTELSQRGIVEPVGKTVCEWTKKTVTLYAIREKGNN